MKKILNLGLSVAVILFIFSNIIFAQQELKICALRVSFQEDQNSLTTGNGLFLMDTTDNEEFTIDPAPHNRSYFKDQLLAVKNYYLAASKGQLIVSGEIFPLSQNDSYQLSNEMNYYNPNTTDEINDRQLAQLLIDAIEEADLDPDIDFSLFDVIVIFHAGVGKDIDVGFDETPQDIPSLYLSYEFLKKNVSDTFTGISVDNGASLIKSGIILPETESQVDYELGLTGIFASNIASHLGMYDLFSATEQATGIGQFGLMDVGQFNARGLVPSIPCAFSRSLVGWETPMLLKSPKDSIQVNRFKGESTQDISIIKIPINSDEYYLLEYRGDRSINLDSVYFELYENRDTEPTYLEVLKTYLPDNITVSDSTGVLLKVEDYDWGLPGAGILIWHVDEKVIEEKSAINRINDDPENRGVDLEEADGSQDIGYSYDITEPGYQSELGTWLDFWFSMRKYRPLYKNEFSPTSSPNTKSNRNYADSHIILNNFSNNRSDAMTFDYSRDYFENGFPVKINMPDNVNFNSLKSYKSTANNYALITSDNNGNIYSITTAGIGLFSDSTFLIGNIQSQENVELSLGDSNNDNVYDILIATTSSGEIAGFNLSDSNNDLFADTIFTKNLGEQIVSKPVIKGQYFYIATYLNRIYEFDFNGNQQGDTLVSDINSDFVITNRLSDIVFSGNSTFNPIVVDLNSDGNRDIITFPDSNMIEIDFNNGNVKNYLTDYKFSGQPAIGDMDLDGYYEIIYNSEKMILAINYNNSRVMNMPISPVLLEYEKLIGSPLIADIDNDGLIDVISVTNQGQIFAFNSSRKELIGFPLSAGGNVITSPLLVDIDNDNQLELFTIDQSGNMNGWQFEDGYNPDYLWWTQESFSADNNKLLNKNLTPQSNALNDLLPSKKVYNYPNPNIDDFTYIRYFLTDDADVIIKIFDLAGDIVDSFKGTGDSGVDQEVKWNVSNVESGVYLGRVEAKSARKSEVRIIKIMVIH